MRGVRRQPGRQPDAWPGRGDVIRGVAGLGEASKTKSCNAADDVAPSRPSIRLASRLASSSAALQDLVKRLKPPRVVWLMVPAGEPTAKAVEELGILMAEGDTIIDGGNSFWKDDIARAKALRAKGIHYLDVGTSGGVWGL